MNRIMVRGVVAASLMISAATATARWAELPAGSSVAVAGSRMGVVAPTHWNRSSVKFGKRSESWSFDGPLLNRIDFFGALGPGEPLRKERNKKRYPLPKFAANMSASDVAEMFERTSRIAEQATDFTTDTVAPASFAGSPGFRFTYHYTAAGGLVRRGIASGAVIGGKLYLIAFTAPSLHYYDAGLRDAQAVMDSARLL